MPSDRIIIPTRIRTTEGRFGFTPHRFLRDGFWDMCSIPELVLYFFLSLASNRFGISFYGKEKMARVCKIPLECLEQICKGLKAKDLAAFDRECIQLLSLPERAVVGKSMRHDPNSALSAAPRRVDRPPQGKNPYRPDIKESALASRRKFGMEGEGPVSVAEALHSFTLEMERRSK